MAPLQWFSDISKTDRQTPIFRQGSNLRREKKALSLCNKETGLSYGRKNLAVPLFLPRNAATRQRSDNRLPLYRSGSVRPTGFPVQAGRSEASIQLHPPLPRTARQLSGGGKETAFSSSTRFLYVTWIIARLSGSVKHTNAKVLSRRTSAMSNDPRKQGIVGIPSLCVCVFPLLAHIPRGSGYTNPSVV